MGFLQNDQTASGSTLSSSTDQKPPNSESDENNLWKGRMSWRHYGRLITFAFGWFAVALIIGFSKGGLVAYIMFWLTLILWFIVIAKILYGVLLHKYMITNQRLFVEKGILGKTIDQTELIRVDDVRITKTLFDRMMNLGDVTIMSTDTSNNSVTLLGIEEPEKVADCIREQMKELRQKSVYVEKL